MTEPFHHEDFIAGIQAVVRRSDWPSQLIHRKAGGRPRLRTLGVHGALLHLTGEDRAITLHTLLQGATLTKDMFSDGLYGGMDGSDITSVDVIICKLRKKLGLA